MNSRGEFTGKIERAWLKFPFASGKYILETEFRVLGCAIGLVARFQTERKIYLFLAIEESFSVRFTFFITMR